LEVSNAKTTEGEAFSLRDLASADNRSENALEDSNAETTEGEAFSLRNLAPADNRSENARTVMWILLALFVFFYLPPAKEVKSEYV
jgi:hypothetical protein